jgi:arginyl-tRNA synthetase
MQDPSAVESHDFLAIPLKQIPAGNQIEYVSALAFKLSQSRSLCSQRLAEQIQAHLDAQTQTVVIDTPPERIWQHFSISIVTPGWIHLRLTDSGLAEWLQWALDFPWQSTQPTDICSVTSVGADAHRSAIAFDICHAYARCNSLLHLGREGKLIQFQVEPDQPEALIHFSQPIPWLDNKQTFVAQHPQEWALIRQLSEAIDALAIPAPKTASSQADRLTLKRTHHLSQTFQHFHAACRIWGMDTQNPSLAQVRLGLVLLTQRVLRALIETRLQWVAPSRL